MAEWIVKPAVDGSLATVDVAPGVQRHTVWVDLYEILGTHLMEQNAIGIYKEVVGGTGYAGADVRVDQIGHPEARHEMI